MASLYHFSEPEIVAFALVLLRLSAFVVSWPVFGVETVPQPVKVLFALVLTVMVFPVIDWQSARQSFDSPDLPFMALKEVFIGLTFGFLARLLFMAMRIASEMISLSMGLAGAQLFNPAMGGQTTPMDQFLFTLAALIFLAINGHHLFLTGVVDTFRLIPIGPLGLSSLAFSSMGQIIQEVVVMGIKLSAPIILAIFTVNLVMGILGKTVPQLNILVTSLAVNVIVGLVVLILALPYMMGEMPDLLETTASRAFQVMRGF